MSLLMALALFSMDPQCDFSVPAWIFPKENSVNTLITRVDRAENTMEMNIATDEVLAAKLTDSELVFKHVNLAIKCLQLYPANHSVTEEAIDKLWLTLSEYFKNHGHLAFRITRETVFVGSEPATRNAASVRSLALQLYRLKLEQVLIQATIDRRQLLELLMIVCMDPNDVSKAGGVQELLLQKQVTAVKMAQASLKLNREAEAGHVDTNTEIDDQAGLAAAQQALLLDGDITELERRLLKVQLAQGTEQLAGFLETLGDSDDKSKQAAAILQQALPKIDALIKRELADEQAFLYRNLSEALLALSKPLSTELAAKLIMSSDKKTAAAAGNLLAQLTGEELVKLFDLALGAGDLPQAKFLEFIEGAPLRPEQLRDLVPFLQGRALLDDKAAKQLLTFDTLKAKKAIPTKGANAAKIADLAGDLDPAGLEKLAKEMSEVSESRIEKESLATLADVIAVETDPARFTRASHAISRILVNAFEHLRLGVAGDALSVIMNENARRHDEPDIVAILKEIKRDAGRAEKIDLLLLSLENESDTSMAEAIHYLTLLGNIGIITLLDMLALESRQSRRRLICQLLAASGKTNISSLGHKVMDRRWYLVRNVALILGQIGDANSVIYLQKAAAHDDPRVRLEVAKALANTGPAAIPIIVGMTNDKDIGVKLEAVRAIGRIKHPDTVDALLKIIRRPNFFKRHVDVKVEAIGALGRLQDERSAPCLAAIAGTRSIFFKSQQAKLSAAARMALGRLHGKTNDD